MKGNQNTMQKTILILTMYTYNQESDQYCVNGRTAALKAPFVLHVNVSKNIIHVNATTIKLSTNNLEELCGYLPFSNDIDISSRLASLSHREAVEPQTDDDCDEYIVEAIRKKQFNSRLGRYEFLVK